MSWTYKNLNLAGVKVQQPGGTMLKPGKYIVKTSDAQIKPTKNGGHQVVVKLTDVNGEGTIQDYINVHTPSSDEAERIGLERLMALLTFGGHPRPEKANSNIAELNGLTVGVVIDEDEFERTDDNGVVRKIKGSKPRRSGAYFDPADLGYRPNGARGFQNHAAGEPPDLDDTEIPF